MMQFYAPFDVVSEKFCHAWTNWHLNGLGKTVGFCLTLFEEDKAEHAVSGWTRGTEAAHRWDG